MEGTFEPAAAPRNAVVKIKDDEDAMYVLWRQQLHSSLFPGDTHTQQPPTQLSFCPAAHDRRPEVVKRK